MPSSNLSLFNADISGPKGNLGDYQHGARLFVDDNLRLAPKSKFNFHVVFSINKSAISLPFANQNEINMLVKSVDLPRFEITTTVANQYNRKKIIQTKSDFKPINISMHDDNDGVVRKLWENYYGYYYADYDASKKITNYNRSAMKGFKYISSNYGLDNGSQSPFFTKITIYQLAKHRWNSYTLVNPVITSWNHDTMDYAIGNVLAMNTLTVAYEAVGYDTGDLSQDNPPGFGNEHYDTSPSSLTLGTPAGVLWNAVNNSTKL
jgi:hypothetical protein